MDQDSAIDMLVRHLRDLAASRRNDVARGAETPRLSAALLQQYGRGMAAFVTEIYGHGPAPQAIMAALDEESARIDPDWKANQRDRWAGRPADITAPIPG